MEQFFKQVGIQPNRWMVFGGGGLLFIVFMFIISTIFGFGYILKSVGDTEIGVRLVNNQPVEVLKPGVYTDWSPLNSFSPRRIVSVTSKALPFQVEDPEVLTKDRQRIGVVVAGTVHRPNITEASQIIETWGTLQSFYRDDDVLIGENGLMKTIGGGAMKVCVGDVNFDDAVIGSSRDILSECIEREIGERANKYGLSIRNVVVPNVVLAPDVQKQLDSITSARLAKQVADQRALQNAAEAQQENAKQQGAILVEQGKIQEKAKQDAITASLQVKALEAQRGQIEADKNNVLLSAQRDKDIADAKRQAAMLQAQADIAGESAKATMYQQNPTYANVQMTNAMAAAYKATDKVIVVPEGTNPITLLGDAGRQAIIQTPAR